MIDIVSSKAAVAAEFSAINQQNFSFSFRQQAKADEEWVEKLHLRAFGPGRFALSAFRVREIYPLDLELCLIGEIELPGQKKTRVGSVWMTAVSLGEQRGYLLGPLAIDPAFRNKGLGKILVGVVTKMALDKTSCDFVILVGDEKYYGSIGFKETKPGTIVFPGPVDAKRILVCSLGGAHVKIPAGSIV